MLIKYSPKPAKNDNVLVNLIERKDLPRTTNIIEKIEPYLNDKEKIIDIGAGNCTVSNKLIKMGYNVLPVDIKDLSIYSNLRPVIYNGSKLPFEESSFDVSLLITTLHHTNNPEQLLKEAVRVSKKLVIMEDTYKNTIQKYLTYLMDNFTNHQFLGLPHTNKSEEEWEDLFYNLGLKVKAKYTHNFWKFFTSTTYYLKKM